MLKVPADNEGISEVARRARGTPRIALRLLRRVRDFAQVRGEGVITRKTASGALDLLQVDPLGLDDVDRRVLKTIIEKYDGGPVGLEHHCRCHQRGIRYDHGRCGAVSSPIGFP